MPKKRRSNRVRNPVAKALRAGHCRPQVVASKKAYKRRPRTPSEAELLVA